MTSSSPCSASAAGRGSFSPQRCVSGYRTTPTMPGSLAQRRGSPVRVIAPRVAPGDGRERGRGFWGAGEGGGEGRLEVLELERLLVDGVDDATVTVADVHRHQLAVEVEDPAALGGEQVHALGVVDRDRIQGSDRK